MNEYKDIPYIVFEGAMSRNERHIKRLIIAFVIAVLLLFTSNMIWLYAWCQYDYTGDECVVTIDGQEGGNANYIGHDGDITNGTDNCSSQDEIQN